MKMRIVVILVLLAALGGLAVYTFGNQSDTAERARLRKEAQDVTITRDDWGIAHVHGKTDAEAVFGMEYAQAEDDFHRVEFNYVTSLGRMAQFEGESAIWQDLRLRLFFDDDTLKHDYAQSPAWLQALMNGMADGLNYYLITHPDVKPMVITHFEPWMALALTEGSVPLDGDIVKVNLNGLKSFYGTPSDAAPAPDLVAPFDDDPAADPGGSNGIAIAPMNTVDHHSLLLINPHTSFYFRSELQMSSDQGLDAYGAATWGQFFIYQGFNPHVGWMHTSSGVNAVSRYLETVTKKGDGYVYKYGDQEKPVIAWQVTIPYKTDTGMAQRTFTVYKTQHGPVIGTEGDKWETIALMQKPIEALEQSYERTKATSYADYLKTMQLHANSSNNTIFADSDGDIAYWHANFIPRRNEKYDWNRPVDGSDPGTDWGPPLSVDETPHLLNPSTGWIYNSNNWPWSAAGSASPKRADFPSYVETGQFESPRGKHAIRLLSNTHNFTLDSLMAAAYDSYQPWFADTVPSLIKAWDSLPADNPLKSKTADQIALLRNWDYRWAADSVPTSLAVYWGEDVMRSGSGRGRGRGRGAPGGGAPAGPAMPSEDRVAQLPPDTLLQSLVNATDKLTADFGTWKTPWGDINRFQRLDDNIVPDFSDDKPSIPVEFTSATWGSLASFAARSFMGSKKIYGSSGNSFVAVIEFGPTIHARAVTAGGESGNPASKHFDDEAERYANGNLRTVYFYPAQLKGHTERVYHPGE